MQLLEGCDWRRIIGGKAHRRGRASGVRMDGERWQTWRLVPRNSRPASLLRGITRAPFGWGSHGPAPESLSKSSLWGRSLPIFQITFFLGINNLLS